MVAAAGDGMVRWYHPGEEFAAAPDGSAVDLDAFALRVEDAKGYATNKSFAARLGISIPTLRKILAREWVRDHIHEKVKGRLAQMSRRR